MSEKSTMTLALSERENAVLEDLARVQDLSKTGVLRQALRLYQLVHDRNSLGQKMAFVDGAGNIIKIEIIGLEAFN